MNIHTNQTTPESSWYVPHMISSVQEEILAIICQFNLQISLQILLEVRSL